MKKIINIEMTIVIMLLTGCINHNDNIRGKTDSGKFIDVNIDEIKSKFCLDDIAKSVSYINIGRNDSIIIGKVDNIVSAKNQYILYDNDITQTVYVIDANGKIKTKIYKKGRGPGEYYSIREVRVDTVNNNTIYILDPTGKILIYTNSGQYLSTVNLNGVIPKSFILYKDKGFLIYTHHARGNKDNEIFRLVFTNLNGEVQKKMLPTNVVHDFVNFGFPNQIWETNNEILVSTGFVNDIWKLDNHFKVSIALHINFLNASSPLNPFQTPTQKIRDFYKDKHTAYYVERFMSTKSLIYFMFVNGKSPGYYLNVNGKGITAKYFVDKFGTFVSPKSINKNKLICYIDPMDIKQIPKGLMEERDSLYKINFNLGNNITPIIVIYEF